MPLCSFLTTISHSGPRVPAGSRSSLRPLSIEGEATKQSSGETRREDAKVCLRLKIQAEEATSMHLAPSLRAQRSNPEVYPRKDSGLLRCARNDDVDGGVHQSITLTLRCALCCASRCRASLEGRRPGYISAVHPSMLSPRCIRIADLAPQDDGMDIWIASVFAKASADKPLRSQRRC